jgi:predicted dehydrogenase
VGAILVSGTRVRFGLIGCGDIARKRVAPALLESSLCELIAVSRAQFDKAEAFAKEFGAKRWYADWRDLLKDAEIDAVYVATPVFLHAEQVIATASAGKHVLCEKPMALDASECLRMIEACNATNVKLGVAYYRHFYPVVRRVKEIISNGEIGSPVLVQCNAFEWFDVDESHPRAWLLRKEQSGGGPMMDFGCHRIEVLMGLFGKVNRVESLQVNSFFKREVEDVAVASFKFVTGTVATLTVAHSAREPQDTLEVFGSEGSLHIPVLNEGKLDVKTIAGERTEFHPPAANIHQPLIEDFAMAVLEDREPTVSGELGLAVAEIEEQMSEKL